MAAAGRIASSHLSPARLKELTAGGAESTEQAVKSGLGYVRSSLGSLPVLNSIVPSSGDQAVDETHYFLVPYTLEASGHVLVSSRRLPEGVGPSNDLPKARVFHLPGPHARERLIELIGRRTADPATGRTTAESLTNIADELDAQAAFATGGMIVVGGLVALANPIAGAALAAQALVPAIGAVAGREGLRFFADKVTTWGERREKRAERKRGEQELGGSLVSSVTNPLLAALERSLASPGDGYDPLMQFDFEAFELEGHDSFALLQLTCRSVTEVYRDAMNSWSKRRSANIGRDTRRWLEVVASYAAGVSAR